MHAVLRPAASSGQRVLSDLSDLRCDAAVRSYNSRVRNHSFRIISASAALFNAASVPTDNYVLMSFGLVRFRLTWTRLFGPRRCCCRPRRSLMLLFRLLLALLLGLRSRRNFRTRSRSLMRWRHARIRLSWTRLSWSDVRAWRIRSCGWLSGTLCVARRLRRRLRRRNRTPSVARQFRRRSGTLGRCRTFRGRPKLRWLIPR
jgi:hypothetical protein